MWLYNLGEKFGKTELLMESMDSHCCKIKKSAAYKVPEFTGGTQEAKWQMKN